MKTLACSTRTREALPLAHRRSIAQLSSALCDESTVRRAHRGASALVLGALHACSSADSTSLRAPVTTPTGLDAERAVLTGEQLFSLPFPGARNQRSCATCHVPEDNFTLSPRHVERLLESNPDDPLFSAIDADDPTATPLTFEHLKKGLVRVVLTLPENMDIIDSAGNVTTPPSRTFFVWRSVPSVANTALTGPFQLDGRAATLEEQAQGAITGHSEGGERPLSELERIASYERGLFSSPAARLVAEQLERGAPLSEIERLTETTDTLQLSPAEARGKEVYEQACGGCHGGPSKATIVDRELHAQAFPALRSDGTVVFQVPATAPPSPVLESQPQGEFLNIGSAMENFLVQIGATEHVSFTGNLAFPNYRFRFYEDGSRGVVVADLPPALPAALAGILGGLGQAGDGEGAGPADSTGPKADGADGDGPTDAAFTQTDSDGNPITGPNLFPQLFTTDPGRAAITGDPNDFEAFDVPTLRGIGQTAPYWHNNISSTLEEVVSLYSDHLLSKFPSLTLPGDKEVDPDGDIGPPEALTAEQKTDLVAFLRRL